MDSYYNNRFPKQGWLFPCTICGTIEHNESNYRVLCRKCKRKQTLLGIDSKIKQVSPLTTGKTSPSFFLSKKISFRSTELVINDTNDQMKSIEKTPSKVLIDESLLTEPEDLTKVSNEVVNKTLIKNDDIKEIGERKSLTPKTTENVNSNKKKIKISKKNYNNLQVLNKRKGTSSKNIKNIKNTTRIIQKYISRQKKQKILPEI